MGRYILVDTENVNLKSLEGVEFLNPSDKIFLFLSNSSKMHYTQKKIDKLDTKATIQKINVLPGVKNSLDFQLVSFLGLMIGEHKQLNISNDYYIISNDNGFLSSINLLNGYTNKIHIELLSKLLSIPEIKKFKKVNTSSKNITCEDKLREDLRKKFKNKTVDKILSAITKDCSDILDVKLEVTKAFGYNPAVYKQAEFILTRCAS